MRHIHGREIQFLLSCIPGEIREKYLNRTFEYRSWGRMHSFHLIEYVFDCFDNKTSSQIIKFTRPFNYMQLWYLSLFTMFDSTTLTRLCYQQLHNETLLRILAIYDHKISQRLVFLGYWHKCIHGTPIHLILKFGATIGSILKFESKWLMSGQTSCIASILKIRFRNSP